MKYIEIPFLRTQTSLNNLNSCFHFCPFTSLEVSFCISAVHSDGENKQWNNSGGHWFRPGEETLVKGIAKRDKKQTTEKKWKKQKKNRNIYFKNLKIKINKEKKREKKKETLRGTSYKNTW